MQTEKQSNMLKESLEAPSRVQKLLDSDKHIYKDLAKDLQKLEPVVVATIARGSSDHCANFASYLIPQCTGKIVASIAPSIVTKLESKLKLKNQFVLAISQSGKSPDTVDSLKAAKRAKALTAALVNDENSPLSAISKYVLNQYAGPELSIAATKTVICSMTAITRLTAQWSKDKKLLKALPELPESLKKACENSKELDVEILKNVSHVYVLSRGMGMSAALELALKLKEVCGIHAEAFSAAEVRHGPREIVDKNYLVIAIAFLESGGEDVLAAAQELKNQGARVLVVGPHSKSGFNVPQLSDFRLDPILTLQLLYPWLAKSSEVLGRNPDRPTHLKCKVVETV